MSLRALLARPLLAAHRLAGLVRRPPIGAVRMVILHDVPPPQWGALGRLVNHASRRFGVIGPDEARARLAGEAKPDRRAPVLFTFDDGFRTNFDAAGAVLDPLGVKALFFVCPGLVDLPPAQRPAAVAARVLLRPGAEAPALMEWDDIRTLERAGHGIGCHGMDHARLAGLGAAALEHQVGAAGRRLAAALGHRVDWYAFTFGDVGSIDSAGLTAIGAHFPLCRSGVRGLAHAGTPPLALPAEAVDLESDWAWQCLALEGGLAPLYRRRLARLAAMADPR